MKRALYLATAALTLAAATTGCIGKTHTFCMFNGILKWNKQASDNEWINELIFLGLCIIPVYPISLFADTIVFNSIDFWTGDNPLKELAGVDPNGNPYTVTPNADGTATLVYQDRVCMLTPVENGFAATTADGAPIGTFTRQGSLATFTAPDGTTRTVLR